MASKRKAGRVAHRKAVVTYRKNRRKSKRSVLKLYSAKVGKSTYNRLRYGKR